MNPHRSRTPRQDGAALRYLRVWRGHVVYTERLARHGDTYPWVEDCPCCEYTRADIYGARARLQQLMHHGGRRAHRLCVAVTELDERLRAVTVEAGLREAPWWERRHPRDPDSIW